MLKNGMSYEEVMEMVEKGNWEVLKKEECEQYGDQWIELTILQDDHAVFVQVDDEGVYELQFVPMWALN